MRKSFIFRAIVSLFLTNAMFAQQPAENKTGNSIPRSAVKASKVIRVRGNVLAVEDSNRIKFAADDGSVYTLSLLAVDAPDEKQSYYKKAKKRLTELIEGKEVTAMVRSGDKVDRTAVIYAGAEDVGLRLIQDGLAWYFPVHSREQSTSEREKYIQAEAVARAARLGLWEDRNPVPPWTFRGEKIELERDAPLTSSSVMTSTPPPAASRPPETRVPGRTYILGPRGGCYYLNDKGYKVYVKDKSLCDKPQQ